MITVLGCGSSADVSKNLEETSIGDLGSESIPDSEAGSVVYSWNEYLGGHYRERDWSKSIRDPAGPSRGGFVAADALIEVIDNNGVLITKDLDDFNNLYLPDIAEALENNTLVIQFGGLGSAKDSDVGKQNVQEFLDLIEVDVSIYRDAMYERAKAIAQLENSDRVYWQIGNEISAISYSENLHEWAGDGLPAVDSDQTIIPIFVEYFLAPGVEGIEKASQEVFGETGRIHLMLGSVVNINQEHKQEFINAMLDYEIQGTFAPSLYAKSVAEVIDSISIHYSIGAPGGEWESYLDEFIAGRMGEGKRLRNIFVTEEIGGSAASGGEAQGAIVRILSRNLAWWQKHDWGPDRGQLFLYAPDIDGLDDGGNSVPNTSAGYFLSSLMPLIGHESLSSDKELVQIESISDNLEWYSFLTPKGQRLIALFSADNLLCNAGTVVFEYEGMGHPNITLFQLEKNSMSEFQLDAVSIDKNKYEIDLTMHDLEGFDALVLIIHE